MPRFFHPDIITIYHTNIFVNYRFGADICLFPLTPYPLARVLFAGEGVGGEGQKNRNGSNPYTGTPMRARVSVR